jgi:hypothetical protein
MTTSTPSFAAQSAVIDTEYVNRICFPGAIT